MITLQPDGTIDRQTCWMIEIKSYRLIDKGTVPVVDPPTCWLTEGSTDCSPSLLNILQNDEPLFPVKQLTSTWIKLENKYYGLKFLHVILVSIFSILIFLYRLSIFRTHADYQFSTHESHTLTTPPKERYHALVQPTD